MEVGDPSEIWGAKISIGLLRMNLGDARVEKRYSNIACKTNLRRISLLGELRI
jgi:hypothetical protein